MQKEIDASPTVKARHRVQTKDEILQMCEKQFARQKTKEATMHGRAMDLFHLSKEKKGVRRRDVIKPETMAHFHIEAFGDQIECNRYESNNSTDE